MCSIEINHTTSKSQPLPNNCMLSGYIDSLDILIHLSYINSMGIRVPCSTCIYGKTYMSLEICFNPTLSFILYDWEYNVHMK